MFHNFGRAYGKERSDTADLDLGMDHVPFTDDLNDRLWACIIVFGKMKSMQAYD